MDYKELIESGKLELHALGALDSNEAKEIDHLLSTNEEVRKEYEEIVEALQQYGRVTSQKPSLDALERAKSEIEELEKDAAAKESKVVPMLPEPTSESNRLRWLAIAASVLLVVSIGLNVKLGSDLENVRADYLALESENRQMATNTVRLEEEGNRFAALINEMSSAGVQKTDMGSTEKYDGYEASVFWNKQSSKVVLAFRDLPDLRDNEQYQLWAIVDGEPVDAGIFDSKDKLVEMKAIQGDAAAFAVTIEPKGGSVSPTLENMCMVGNVPG